jgi:hypothetical protein
MTVTIKPYMHIEVEKKNSIVLISSEEVNAVPGVEEFFESWETK